MHHHDAEAGGTPPFPKKVVSDDLVSLLCMQWSRGGKSFFFQPSLGTVFHPTLYIKQQPNKIHGRTIQDDDLETQNQGSGCLFAKFNLDNIYCSKTKSGPSMRALVAIGYLPVAQAV